MDITIETRKLSKETVANSVCEKLGLEPVQMSAGGTVNTEVLDRICEFLGINVTDLNTSYRKLEALLSYCGLAYDPELDSSEHSPTGGGTITTHGWRKLARGLKADRYCFILNHADADVSAKYGDKLGEIYGFNQNVTGRNAILESGEGSFVVFYNTSNSTLEPKMAFIGSAEVSSVETLPGGVTNLHLKDYKTFIEPISKADVESQGWNSLHGIAEISTKTFDSLVEAGQPDVSTTQDDSFEVDIRPDAGSLRMYRGMTYTAHYALGEFIDNSLTSAMKNRAALVRVFGDDYTLRVNVEFNKGSNELLVTDNAAGIPKSEIGNALKAGKSSSDSSIGLGKYGVGMKAAAFWFGAVLDIETYPIGEESGWRVIVDISGDAEVEPSVSVKPIPHRGAPGTILKVKKLWDGVPHGAALKVIGNFLPSIYRTFLSESSEPFPSLGLVFNGEPLRYHAPEILDAPYWPNQDGPLKNSENRIWRVPIKIELEENVTIHGWAGILKTMSRDLSGFTLFYRGKAIAGAVPVSDENGHEDQDVTQTRSYKPKNIFKQSGSKLDQSIVGELDISDLGKTITTDNVRWTQDQQARFVVALEAELADGDESLLRMAQNYRRRLPQLPKVDQNTIAKNDADLEKKAQENLDGNVTHGTGDEEKTQSATSTSEKNQLDGEAVKVSLHDDQGHEHKFRLSLCLDRNEDFFKLQNLPNDRHEIAVNLAHPIFDSVDSIDADSRKILQWIMLSLGVAEIFADTQDGVILRRKFNNIFEILSREIESEGAQE